MTVAASADININVAGVTVKQRITRNDDQGTRLSLALPAAIAGTLSTRTDASSGVLTVATGHGIQADDEIGIFWEGGLARKATVASVTGTTITFAVDDGDDLPAATTAVTTSVIQVFSLDLVGDSIIVMAIGNVGRISMEFLSSAPASLLTYDIAENEGRSWIKSLDTTNPLAGDTVDSLEVSNGSTTAQSVDLGLLLTAN